jgi:ABC-type sugar transport system permease subunit
VKKKTNQLMALLQMPSVAVLLVWMIVPLLMTIYFSFIRFSLLNPDVKGFAGIENYQFLVTDESFWPAIINTIILIGAVLVITVVFGVLLAVPATFWNRKQLIGTARYVTFWGGRGTAKICDFGRSFCVIFEREKTLTPELLFRVSSLAPVS